MSEDNPRAVQRSVYEALEYAEVAEGLDPIGSSDILSDLATFAWDYCLWNGPTDPDKIWREFKFSEYWERYWPSG